MIGQSRVVAVLGIDGSGKSTVSRHVAETLSRDHRACLVGDRLTVYEGGAPGTQPVPVSERLRHSIHVAAKRARSLKSYKYPKLADLFLRDRLAHVMARRYRPGAIVMDGSPLLNMIAWASLYRDGVLTADICGRAIGALTGLAVPQGEDDPLYTALPELVTIRRLGLNRLTLPDLCLVLDLPAAAACERVRRRGDPAQVHETEEKLGRLRRAYLEVCGAARDSWKARVRILNADRPLEDTLREAVQTVREHHEPAD